MEKPEGKVKMECTPLSTLSKIVSLAEYRGGVRRYEDAALLDGSFHHGTGTTSIVPSSLRSHKMIHNTLQQWTWLAEQWTEAWETLQVAQLNITLLQCETLLIGLLASLPQQQSEGISSLPEEKS
jgi:hypothetical protein